MTEVEQGRSSLLSSSVSRDPADPKRMLRPTEATRRPGQEGYNNGAISPGVGAVSDRRRPLFDKASRPGELAGNGRRPFGKEGEHGSPDRLLRRPVRSPGQQPGPLRQRDSGQRNR